MIFKIIQPETFWDSRICISSYYYCDSYTCSCPETQGPVFQRPGTTMGQTAIQRNALSQCQAVKRFLSSPVGYPHDRTTQAASPAALPFCRISCLEQRMNTEKVPQLCHPPGSCQGCLLTKPVKIPLISGVPLAGLCPGEFSSVVLQAQEPDRSTDKRQSFRTRYFYIQNRAFLHRNLYSHRDLYIQAAHAFVFDGAGTLDHNSLVCLNSFKSLCLESSQKICDYFLQLRFCLVRDLPFGPAGRVQLNF